MVLFNPMKQIVPDEVQCGPVLEVVTRSGVLLAGVSDIGDGRHGGWRSEDEARSGEKRSLWWCVKNSAKKIDFPEFLCLKFEKAHVRDELDQTNWTKKNNSDILLSSLPVNALYCICSSYCFIVQ